MGKSTFSNEMLVRTWAKVAAKGGTRRNVIVEIMKSIEQDPADKLAYSRMYNNITQRVKLLKRRNEEAKGNLVFVDLKLGRRGASVDSLELERLADIMGTRN